MSGTVHQFGGDWTEEKLNRLALYLPAYTKIFHVNEAARYLSTHYVDAFAGSGRRTGPAPTIGSTLSLFDETEARNVERFYDGSARVALRVEPPFDNYLFVETNPSFVQELQGLRHDFPDRAEQIRVVRGEANHVLQQWCRRTNWRSNRAVVFLDPYGMSVNWQTIETLGATRGVDLWALLPIGQAINRMLPRQGPPTGAWADKLTAFFGTNEWRDRFYRERVQESLFEDDEALEKQATFETISDYFTERLEAVFKYVPKRPRMLTNSRNVPIFGLYFATWNEAGNNIASYILGR